MSTTQFVPRTTKARAFLQELGVPASRIEPWIPSGVDTDSLRPGKATSTPDDYGWLRDCHMIGVVGRLGAAKGVDLAIRALPLVRRRGVSAGLLIRGSGPLQKDSRRLA